MTAIAERWDESAAREIAAQQFIGSAGLAAERVGAAMHIGSAGGSADADLDAIAKLFQIHPAFYPRAYVDLSVERGNDAVLCAIRDSDAFNEGDAYSWFALLAASDGVHPALDAIVRTVNPRARCRRIDSPGARDRVVGRDRPERRAGRGTGCRRPRQDEQRRDVSLRPAASATVVIGRPPDGGRAGETPARRAHARL